MMLLGVDLETTGLDVAKDRIIELGAAIWDTDVKAPVAIFNALLIDGTYPPISQEITDITGITQNAANKFGIPPLQAFTEVNELTTIFQPEYVVGYNGRGFDFPFLKNEYVRAGLTPNMAGLPTLDPIEDLPLPQKMRGKRFALSHLAAEHGFVNPFAHRAIFDVLTMFKVMAQYPIEEIIKHSKIPWVVIQAVVGYEDRELAKARKFSWEKLGTETFTKKWVKKIKQTELESEVAQANFRITILRGDANATP